MKNLKSTYCKLPENWKEVKLKELVYKTEYGTSKKTNESEGVPVLGISNLSNGEIIQKGLKYVQLTKKEFSKLRLNNKDILFNRTNSYEHIGKTALFDLEDDYVFASYLVRLKVDSKKILPEYLNYFMNSEKSKMELKRLSTKGVQQVNINPTSLRNMFLVNLPPLKEQGKITSILSTWDKAIKLKEGLIEQKKLQKKGLMQKLLTGELRLPIFDQKWKEVSLGDLGELKTSSVDKKNNSEEFPISLVNYMDVYKNGIIDETINYMQVTATEKQIRTFKVNYGDVLFTPSSEKSDDIGHSAVIKIDKENLLFSYHLIRLQFYDDMDINFKAYVFNSPTLLKDFARKSTGSTRYTLSLKDFKESKVKIPSDYEEQKAIGEVLLNIDKEIELRQRELKKLEQQKKGLIQILLTGEVRVNV